MALPTLGSILISFATRYPQVGPTKAELHVHSSSSSLQDTESLDNGGGHTVLGLVDIEVAQGAVSSISLGGSYNAVILGERWRLTAGFAHPSTCRRGPNSKTISNSILHYYLSYDRSRGTLTWISPKASLSVREAADCKHTGQ